MTAGDIEKLVGETGFIVYPESVTAREGVTYCLGRKGPEKRLLLLYREAGAARDFRGKEDAAPGALKVKACPLTHENAVALREKVTFTSPVLIGVRKTVGCGDRLGLATPAHVMAVRGKGVKPVFAQQSIREMTRTERTPEMVMDDATWGVFQEGFRDGFGSDADHLKTTADADRCVKAGFTMFTADPGEFVDDSALEYGAGELKMKFESLPWSEIECSASGCAKAYADRTFRIGNSLDLKFDTEVLMRSAVKYLRAVAHTVKIYRHVSDRMGEGRFEFEVSVDETAAPTSPHEHFLISSELRRLGVRWVSLAPRFVGDFEKGVDYKGDPGEFEKSFALHVELARWKEPYKISIHSGSDKFSIYPIVARQAGDLVHLKTAGTSYLEAVRTVAEVDPEFFREILKFALGRYETDKASYHVSADLRKVKPVGGLADNELPALVGSFDARQALHVSFGSVLTSRSSDGSYLFRDRLLEVLRKNEEAHYGIVARHISKHVDPFC